MVSLKKAVRMAIVIPTPEEVEAALIPVKWLYYFVIGLSAILGISYTTSKGKKECTLPHTPPENHEHHITKEHVENLIQIGVLQSESRIKDHMDEELKSSRETLVADFTRILNAKFK